MTGIKERYDNLYNYPVGEEPGTDYSGASDLYTGGMNNKSLTGLLLSGGVALAGQGINYLANRETNQANGQMQQEANRQNVDLWRMQTEYNTPANQIARLRQANLNPNLIYGNPANTAGSAPEMKASKNERYQLDPMTMANVMLMSKQMQNLEADNEVKQAEARNINADTRGIELDNIRKDFDNSNMKQVFEQSLRESESIIQDHIASSYERMSRFNLNANQLDEAKKTFDRRSAILEKEFEEYSSRILKNESERKMFIAYAKQALELAKNQEFLNNYYKMYQDPNAGAFDKEGNPISYMASDLHANFTRQDIELDWFSEEYATYMQNLPRMRELSAENLWWEGTVWRRILKETDYCLGSTIGNVFAGGTYGKGSNPIPSSMNYGKTSGGFLKGFKPKLGF